ncbi:hypothetical protein [Bacillus sp. ISL-46]|uniref:hypothetical protein n=1 Tax=Bacillus sp. ISL-46 TaxID=2819129 RepID=UPI001BE8D830|nr:hypothetical protein [Bacillus sp. ISL-46]MBT2721430.1 hypothetical protein [Bacillus sp. ISL-46]
MFRDINDVLSKVKEGLKNIPSEEVERLFYKYLDKGKDYAKSRTYGHEKGLFYYTLLGGFMTGYIKTLKKNGGDFNA